jgi:hypothetical protein
VLWFKVVVMLGLVSVLRLGVGLNDIDDNCYVVF